MTINFFAPQSLAARCRERFSSTQSEGRAFGRVVARPVKPSRTEPRFAAAWRINAQTDRMECRWMIGGDHVAITASNPRSGQAVFFSVAPSRPQAGSEDRAP